MTEADGLVSRFKSELLGQLVSALTTGLLIVLLARLLDPDGYGLLFLAISVLGILMVGSKLGIGRSAGRYIAEYRDADPSQLPHILRTSVLLNLATVLCTSALLLLGHELIADLLDEPQLDQYLLLGILYVAFGTALKYVRYVLQGFESIRAAAFVVAANRTGRLLLAVGLVLLGFEGLGALVGYVASFAVVSTVGLLYVYRRHYVPHRSAAPMEEGLARRIAEYSLPLTATSTANVLDRRVDTVLVGYFRDPVAVSFYVLGKQAVEFLEKPIRALGFTISPQFGSEDREKARDLYENAIQNILLLYVPAAVGLVLVADPTVYLVFGAEYGGAAPVLQILAAYLVFRSVSRVTVNALDYMGRARLRAYIRGSSALANVLLNVVLIPPLGAVGAAIATLVTFGLDTIANVYIIDSELDLRRAKLARHTAIVCAISGCMAVPVYVLVHGTRSWPVLLASMGLGLCVWLGLSVRTGVLNYDEVRSTLQ